MRNISTSPPADALSSVSSVTDLVVGQCAARSSSATPAAIFSASSRIGAAFAGMASRSWQLIVGGFRGLPSGAGLRAEEQARRPARGIRGRRPCPELLVDRSPRQLVEADADAWRRPAARCRAARRSTCRPGRARPRPSLIFPSLTPLGAPRLDAAAPRCLGAHGEFLGMSTDAGSAAAPEDTATREVASERPGLESADPESADSATSTPETADRGVEGSAVPTTTLAATGLAPTADPTAHPTRTVRAAWIRAEPRPTVPGPTALRPT